MSQITVENIKRSTETASRSTRGVAAAWVNFNGTGTVAVRDSENVASLTDNAAGQYAVNLTNNMSNGDYAYSALNGGSFYTEVLPAAGHAQAAPSITTSSYTIVIRSGSASYDEEIIMSQAHGDLA